MDKQTKFVGWFAALLGAGVFLIGLNELLFSPGEAPTGLSCRVICGLSLIASELFGDTVGLWWGAVLHMVIGAAILVVGIKLLKRR